MGDVSSGKVNSLRGTDGVPTVEPDVSKTAGNTNAKPTQSVTAPVPAPAPIPVPTPQPANYASSPARFQPHAQYAPHSPMNMGNMAYALPGHQSTASPYDHLHHYPGTHTQGMVYPMGPMGHYPGQHPGTAVPYAVPYGPTPTFSPYPMAQHPGAAQHGSPYPPFISSPSMPNMSGPSPTYGPGYYHPGYNASYGPAAHPPVQMRQPIRQSRGSSTSPSKRDDKQSVEEYDVSKTIVDGSNPMRLGVNSDSSTPSYTTSSTPNPPRGPPRKPKQSGHALWVGNLPPGASVIDLKDHFSQEATNDIESVFLISKSNCAFVNYKSAPACSDALTRFHDSRFQGVRLVCRLRKGFTAPGSGVSGSKLREESTLETPASASAAVSEDGNAASEMKQPIQAQVQGQSQGQGQTITQDSSGSRSVDRYFIVKSLTVDDLELSKQGGIWATQSHNETNLNQAFETTEHVYLIFSANKSGEYFGYARMLSPISDDEDLALEMPTRPEPTSTAVVEELEVTLTPATTFAPKGRIIDDSARGTIFWEVESEEDLDDTRSERSLEGGGCEEEEQQSFGKPFRIQWLSTERVPFHRTRGLRNPWNANREVKIARDGTEIETGVGRKLVQLFHLV